MTAPDPRDAAIKYQKILLEDLAATLTQRDAVIAELRAALERLGSMEAFVMSRVVTNHPADQELTARIDFARAALAKGGEEGK